MNSTSIHFKTTLVGGFKIFYREAGDATKPVVLLLHGFPTSSHMFRDLIPHLAEDCHVIAPDLPGFGQSDAPDHKSFQYTFDHLAKIIGDFVEQLGLKKFAVYIFDYGAPVGLRLALRFPERISALISQNGNAYVEGFSDAWEPWKNYWKNPTPENREACRDALKPEVIRDIQYRHGTDAQLVSPDGYTLDIAYMSRPGMDEAQLDLVLDYRSNVALYPRFQEFFRTVKPPTLAIWGKNDPFFLPAGAEAYRRDNPDAKVVMLDTGHFALETHAAEIGREIRQFLAEKLPAKTAAEIAGLEKANLDLANKFLAALRGRDWAAMKALIEPNAVWAFPGSSIISGDARGVDAILHRWQTIVKYGMNFELKHLLNGPDGVGLSLHNTAKRGESIFDEHLVTILKMRDGQNIGLSTYLADVPLLNSFFVP